MNKPFKGRYEDHRLVTGQGRYTADWDLPGQCYGVFLRSDRAHAEIAKIDTDAARKNPRVVAVFTGEDLAQAGYKSPRPIAHFKGKDGTTLKDPHRPALAHGRVRFVGEPVALVVAESETAAQDAAELIAIEYRELPAAIEPQDAIAPGAPIIHDGIPDNLAVDYEYGNKAAADEGFAKAKHVARVTLHAQRLAGAPMEPKSCLAAYDAKSGTFDLYMPTQGMSDIRKELSHVTSLPIEKFRIHAKDVGGAFGVRNEVYPEFAALAFAAQSTGRPVKWTGTRSESMVSDHHARGVHLAGELALDDAGHFLAMRIEWLVNVGAYCSNAGPFTNTAAAPTAMPVGIYRTPALYGLNRLIFTNTTPTAPYRGAGRPSASYLVERLVDEAARITGIDRIDLRRRNLLRKDSFPYKTPTGSTYDSGDPRTLLAEVLKLADWKGFNKRRRESKKRGRLRGIGCATFIEPSGGVGQEEIAIRFDHEGVPQLFSLAGASGQGHETVFVDLVADIFGLAPDKVALRSSDPESPPLVGTGSFGSRSLIAHGSALSVGAKEVVQKGMALAAKELEVAGTDLVFENGQYRVPGTDLAISFEALARKHAGGASHPLDTTTKINIAAAFPSGAHVAEVEIDPATGMLDIVRYTAVDDCGRVFNHTIVEGQLVGGIMQAIGQVLGEYCVYDRDSGQFLTGTFMDYFMPRADALPELAMDERPNPSPTNPLGVKGAGEAGTTGAIPTIANAVMDAVSPLGVHALDMPYTPYKLWSAIQKAGEK
jgi:aerobic carbon-monoxide dehydrogenase large subunit